MKKVLVIVAFATLFIATKTNAQEFKFGLKGGINFAKFIGDDVDADMFTGFHLGAVAEYSFNEKVVIQPELLFSTQGAKADGANFKVKVNYLNLPIMVKYFVSDGFNLQAGPQIGFLLDSKFEGEDVGIDADEAFKNIDFGVNLGLGYQFDEHIFIEGRYNLGLSDIMKEDGNAKNSVFQISLGYIF